MTYALPTISYVQWGKEASYPDETSNSEPATTCDEDFWEVQSINDSQKNNLIKLYQLTGGRDVNSVVNGRFDANLKVECNLTTDDAPWELIIGSLAAGTATPTNTLPSFAVEIGYKDYSGSLKRAKFHGCKINSAALSYNKKGEPVKVSLDILTQRVWITDVLQTPTAPTDVPLTDFECSLELPNASALTDVQSFSTTIAHNLVEQSDNRARFKADLITGKRDYTHDFSLYFNGTTRLENFLGNAGYAVDGVTPDSEATMELTITKGGNTVVILWGVTYFEDFSAPLDIGGDLVVQKFTGFSKTMTSVVVS